MTISATRVIDSGAIAVSESQAWEYEPICGMTFQKISTMKASPTSPRMIDRRLLRPPVAGPADAGEGVPGCAG